MFDCFHQIDDELQRTGGQMPGMKKFIEQASRTIAPSDKKKSED